MLNRNFKQQSLKSEIIPFATVTYPLHSGCELCGVSIHNFKVFG